MSSEVAFEVTFDLSGETTNDVIELIQRKIALMEAVNNPIAGNIAVRMLDDVAKQLGKTLLTESQSIRFLGRDGIKPGEEEKKVSQDRFTFFVNPADTPFLLDLLNQKTMLQRACEEQPDRKGEFMWEIEKLCCRIGNVLVLKNQGLMIDRASISDKEQKGVLTGGYDVQFKIRGEDFSLLVDLRDFIEDPVKE